MNQLTATALYAYRQDAEVLRVSGVLHGRRLNTVSHSICIKRRGPRGSTSASIRRLALDRAPQRIVHVMSAPPPPDTSLRQCPNSPVGCAALRSGILGACLGALRGQSHTRSAGAVTLCDLISSWSSSSPTKLSASKDLTASPLLHYCVIIPLHSCSFLSLIPCFLFFLSVCTLLALCIAKSKTRCTAISTQLRPPVPHKSISHPQGHSLYISNTTA